MKFLQLKLNNIFSILGESVILEDRGLILITGYSKDEGSSNGSGKSSLINKGLLWTLFGETAGGVKGDDVINRHLSNVKASGLLYFTDDHGDEYSIFRSRVKGVSELHFTKNSNDISYRDIRETQKAINEVLGRNVKSFTQTDFFGQGNRSSFMQLTPSAQKEVLENIVSFDLLDEWLKNTKTAKKLVELEYTKIKEEEIKVKSTIEALKTQKTNVCLQANLWIKTQNESLNKLNKELDLIKSNPKERVKELREQIESTLFNARYYPVAGENLDEQILKIITLQQKVQEDLINLNIYEIKETTRLNNSNAILKNQACPTCKRNWNLTAEEIEFHTKEIESINNTLNNIFNQRNDFIKLNHSYISYKSNLEEKIKLIGKLTEEIVELNELQDKKIENIEEEINRINNESNPYTELLSGLDKDLLNNDNLLGAITQKLETINKEDQILNLWEKAYGQDLRLLIYDRICPFLKDRANHHLQELRNAQITVDFSILRQLKSKIKDDFSATASSTTGGATYDLLSGGEQQMVDFAVGLALSDLASTQVKSKSNLLILDEPFVGLDSKNSEAIVAYLQESLSKTKNSIFLISNEETLKGLIPNSIHVEKHNGISKIAV